MERTVQRRPVDIAPDRSRPGLALGLAILSVPGSTLAWDLPAGGYWIGLPLAVAAIYFGTQARRDAGGGTTMPTVAIVIAGLMILQMVVWTASSLFS